MRRRAGTASAAKATATSEFGNQNAARARNDRRGLVFLTNHFGLGATIVARLYKDRWQIELFFKALKQHLRVRTLVGTSPNALHIQIRTALIALLLLKYLQLRARFGWSLSNLVALLRMNLFVYRDLWVWLDDPFTAPPRPPEPTQAALAWTSVGQQPRGCRHDGRGREESTTSAHAARVRRLLWTAVILNLDCRRSPDPVRAALHSSF